MDGCRSTDITLYRNISPDKKHSECAKEQLNKCHMVPAILLVGNVSKPTVSAWNTSTWTLTSPDDSQVERYIVEFECRVQNITFVEKYMSVSASGGTGRVATSVSCFGGLGQLYRVKVWAVSGPNISRQPAVKLVNTGTASTVCSRLLCTAVMIDILSYPQ